MKHLLQERNWIPNLNELSGTWGTRGISHSAAHLPTISNLASGEKAPPLSPRKPGCDGLALPMASFSWQLIPEKGRGLNDEDVSQCFLLKPQLNKLHSTGRSVIMLVTSTAKLLLYKTRDPWDYPFHPHNWVRRMNLHKWKHTPLSLLSKFWVPVCRFPQGYPQAKSST